MYLDRAYLSLASMRRELIIKCDCICFHNSYINKNIENKTNPHFDVVECATRIQHLRIFFSLQFGFCRERGCYAYQVTKKLLN